MKRVASAILLVILLTSMLCSAFKVMPVGATGTIYIRADGSIDPPTAPIQRNGDIYTLTGDIDSDADGIVVERSNIIVDGNGYTLQGSGAETLGTGIKLSGRENVTVRNTQITAFHHNIWLLSSSNYNSISGNNMTNSSYGIALYLSSSCSISGNNITAGHGIELSSCNFNSISGNNITNSLRGILLSESCSFNSISGNNITNSYRSIELWDYSNYNSISGNSLSGNSITANEDYGVWLYCSSNNTVSGNDITNNGNGVGIIYSFSNTVSENNIAANKNYGIFITDNTRYYSSNNTVSGNSIINNGQGVSLYDSSKNTISGNIFVDDGLVMYYSAYNVVVDNLVNGKPLVYLERKSHIAVDIAGQVVLISCHSIRVENLNLSSASAGLQVFSSSNITIVGNNITNNMYGINLGGYYNTVFGNNIANNFDGINLDGDYNTVFGNNITANKRSGINLGGHNNTVSGNIFVDDGLVVSSSYYDNVVVDNLVNGKPLAYLVGKSNFIVEGVGQVILINCSGIRVEGLELSNASVGVELLGTNNTTISGNSITNNYYGIELISSFNNSISENSITANDYSGIFLFGSCSFNSISGNSITANNGWAGIYLIGDYNTVFGNNITNNMYGINLDGDYNEFFHNNFVNNNNQIYDVYGTNVWNEGYPSGGNYWSDYADVDLYSGPNQDEPGSDGIWDHPYVIDANNQDNYPLVGPRAPVPPVASFVAYPNDQPAGNGIVLDASSSYDPDGQIVLYEWDWDGDGDYDDYSGTPMFEAWWIQDGTYNVGLKVVDNTGAESNTTRQVIIRESATSWINTALAEWYDSLNFSQGLGQESLETSPANTIMGWMPDKWRRGYKEFSKVDDWLRELDPGSKPLSWLKGTKFACLEVADVIFVLNIEIDHANAPGFTYQTWAFNAINEERLVHEAWKQSTPQYIYVMEPLFKYAFGTIWSLSISEQAILNLNLPLGIGVSTIRSGLRSLSIKSVMKDIEKTAYSQALSSYFRWRGEGLSADDAWNDPDVSKPAHISLPISANEEERAAILENMRWYFDQLWIKYEGSEHYDASTRAGIPLEQRRLYREQVKNKLLSAMETYSSYLPNKKKCGFRSPVELRIYDSQGRVTGVVDGVELEEIPNSVYDNRTETATILFSNESVTFEVEGTAAGTYELEVTSVLDGQIAAFNTMNIPITVDTTHRYRIDWPALSQGGQGIIVEKDLNGDGIYEFSTSVSGGNVTLRDVTMKNSAYYFTVSGSEETKNWLNTSIPSVNTTGICVFMNGTRLVFPSVDPLGSISTNGTHYFVYLEWNSNDTYEILLAFPIAGDITYDGIVDIFDITTVALAFNSIPGDSNWIPVADINNDGIVDIFDIVVVAIHFGETG